MRSKGSSRIVSGRLAPEAGPPATRFPRTDAGNAELFAHLYGERLRYDHSRKRWLVWGAHWWEADADAEVMRLAKASTRHRYLCAAGIDDLKERQAEAQWAIACESRMRLEAMLSLARAERQIADAGDRWDPDGWLLGAENGVLELKTARFRAGRPEDRITQHANAAFYPDAQCPRWLVFLDEIFGGDRELIDYMWRAVGYSLTGDTSEQCVFICYGSGANGKTTFLTTLRHILGSYGHNMPFSTIEMSGRASVPTDVADLAGKRLVTATETNERNRLNEARLKALSGGDPVTARHLFSNFFEFRPVAKFWLAVNHKPRVEDDSYGFWRRVRLIPFTRVFAADEADKRLVDTLSNEGPAIFAWAVQGCLEWQRRGLTPPPRVQLATAQYQQESDPIAGFLADRCVMGEGITAGATVLYKAYKEWAVEQGLRDREVLSATLFGRRMAERFEKRHSERGNAYAGVGLKAEGFDPDLKGFQSEGTRNHIDSHTPPPLARELEKPSDPSGLQVGVGP